MRATKYVVWLSNHTDREDDEWLVTYAHSYEEAKQKVRNKVDFSRFSFSNTFTIKEFRRFYGRNFPL
jgi:hypothetical protein